MSWVAERNPTIQNSAIVMGRYPGSGSARATQPNPAAIATWVNRTKNFFVLKMSITGDHNGLITHGRYIEPV